MTVSDGHTPTARVYERMQVLRRAHGWSQAELAERMNTSRSVIANLESGRRGYISLEELLGLSRAFKVEPEALWSSEPISISIEVNA